MDIWAKLCECHGRQVLVCKSETQDEGESPAVKFEAMLHGLTAAFYLGFATEELRDKAFDELIDQDFADKVMADVFATAGRFETE